MPLRSTPRHSSALDPSSSPPSEELGCRGRYSASEHPTQGPLAPRCERLWIGNPGHIFPVPEVNSRRRPVRSSGSLSSANSGSRSEVSSSTSRIPLSRASSALRSCCLLVRLHRLAHLLALDRGIGDAAGEESNGADRVIVGRNGVGYRIGVGIGVNKSDNLIPRRAAS